MELRHLKYFVAVAETLSFRGAAERLRVAQPALSKQIRDLEEECGARLFDRNTTRVRLTNAGTLLLDEARTLLAHANRLPGLLREAAHGRRGRLVIGNIGAMTGGFLPASVTAFHAKFPDVDLSLVEMRPREQANALRSGRIHIGLFAGQPGGAADDLERVEIVRCPLAVALPRRHGLSGRRIVRLEELANERHLALTAELGAAGHADIIRSIYRRRGVKEPAIKQVDSIESLLALVASEQGVSLLPQLIGRQRDTGVVMKRLRLDGRDSQFSLWGVRHRDDSSQLIRNFIDVLKTQAQIALPSGSTSER